MTMKPEDYPYRRMGCGLIIACWLVLLALALLLPHDSEAAPVNLTWVNATLNEDGTTIPATGDGALASTTIEYAACVDGALSEPRIPKLVLPAETSVAIHIATPGDWCFEALHTTEAGTASDYSNMVTRTVLDGLFVTDPAVFTIVKQPGMFFLVHIGTIPVGTECDPGQHVNDHNVVPIDLVQWTIEDHPDTVVVVAACE